LEFRNRGLLLFPIIFPRARLQVSFRSPASRSCFRSYCPGMSFLRSLKVVLGIDRIAPSLPARTITFFSSSCLRCLPSFPNRVLWLHFMRRPLCMLLAIESPLSSATFRSARSPLLVSFQKPFSFPFSFFFFSKVPDFHS